MKTFVSAAKSRTSWIVALPLGVTLLLSACADDQLADSRQEEEQANPGEVCSFPASELTDGGPGKDGIPALTNPALVSAAGAANYLNEDSRVIGILVDGEAIAVPHNILWWHEIANFDFPSKDVAITFCPLTGSSIAFDRSVVGGAEFGVSGLLFRNNLTMYDRNTKESLWPQMLLKGGCGPAKGTPLETVPVFEMTWAGWKDLYPDTKVIDSNTGFSRNYTESGYPYGDYEVENNSRLLFEQTINRRRPPKERLLGIPGPDGGIAFPFNELDATPLTVVEETVNGQKVIVFWSRLHGGATAFRPAFGGQDLSFRVDNGTFVDEETGSTWQLDGLAIDGPLAGERLEPISEAYVAFWFAWAAFSPPTRVWTAG
ncbi:MAG: DUF3179 domain-containing protein [Rhodothermia bacterium]|nr:MAG: DUF3179 domain-containing protein [Rhodothermia bacterium]